MASALSLGETHMPNETAEPSRLVSIMNGDICVGFLVRLGPRGVEAFDADGLGSPIYEHN
jgi:hypothetical protein